MDAIGEDASLFDDMKTVALDRDVHRPLAGHDDLDDAFATLIVSGGKEALENSFHSFLPK